MANNNEILLNRRLLRRMADLVERAQQFMPTACTAWREEAHAALREYIAENNRPT